MPFGATALHSNSSKIGTCPHGLPQGACPICNGMAGGNSTTKRDIPRNVGEMTYNQCAAIGAMLKAQKHARAQAQLAQQNHLQVLANFQKSIAAAHQRIIDLASAISKSTPVIIAKPINFILTNVVAKVLNVVQNLPNIVANTLQTIQQKFTDITDNLTAIYGEFKVAVQKKVSEVFGNIKKKIKSLLFIFGADETDDEDKKIDEVKKAFNLKTFLHKVSESFKNKKDIENNDDKSAA